MSLTGRFCFRRTIWGKVVLCVEEEKKAWLVGAGSFRKRWRDASLIDLTHHTLRGLLELRDKDSDLSEQLRPIDLGRQRSTKLAAAADTFVWPPSSTSDGSAVLNSNRSSSSFNGEHSEYSKSAA